MAKRKRPSDSDKNKPEEKSEELKAIYARIRREFSAADLAKYAVIEPTYPIEPLLAELEEKQRRFDARRKKA